LLDHNEALVNGVGDGSSSLLLVAFESADHDLAPWIARARDIAKGAGGVEVEASKGLLDSAELVGAEGDGAAERWKKMFLRAPYMRDALAELGVVVETFETAITWDRFESFHRALREAAREAAERICGSCLITSRVTHVYPDGAAPYFTVLAPGRAGSHLSQWDEIKAAASEAILAAGGTITHHHAVGRDHRPYYDRERPELFAKALAFAKRALDPAGIMNPGVLVG
jgi:alkyldihydroxyacetonephosphate synthase